MTTDTRSLKPCNSRIKQAVVLVKNTGVTIKSKLANIVILT